jgi:hypothetical protein
MTRNKKNNNKPEIRYIYDIMQEREEFNHFKVCLHATTERKEDCRLSPLVVRTIRFHLDALDAEVILDRMAINVMFIHYQSRRKPELLETPITWMTLLNSLPETSAALTLETDLHLLCKKTHDFILSKAEATTAHWLPQLEAVLSWPEHHYKFGDSVYEVVFYFNVTFCGSSFMQTEPSSTFKIDASCVDKQRNDAAAIMGRTKKAWLQAVNNIFQEIELFEMKN